MASAARRMATISACPEGSPVVWVRLCPRAIGSPARTTTAPTGTSPRASAARACASASRIQRSSPSPRVMALDARGTLAASPESLVALAAPAAASTADRRGLLGGEAAEEARHPPQHAEVVALVHQ